MFRTRIVSLSRIAFVLEETAVQNRRAKEGAMAKLRLTEKEQTTFFFDLEPKRPITFTLQKMGKNQSKLTPEQLVDLQKSTYCE